MAGVSYQTTSARLIILWANPSASGIHLIPYIKEAAAGATLVVTDPRHTSLAKKADCTWQRVWHGIADALALHRVFSRKGTPIRRSWRRHARRTPARRRGAVDDRRAAAEAQIDPASLRRLADLYVSTRPAPIRCGWASTQLQRRRRRARCSRCRPSAQVRRRGGGYSMSNSLAFGLAGAVDRHAEPDTRLVNMNHLGAADYTDPPVDMLFVYNCNLLATAPIEPRAAGAAAHRPSPSSSSRSSLTPALRRRAAAGDDVPGTATSPSRGPITLQLVRPVIEPSGEARTNAQVFSELAERPAPAPRRTIARCCA